MSESAASGITVLLRAWRNGDRQALDSLTPRIYCELYRLAQQHMARERSGHVLQNTALINETYIRLSKLEGIDWQDRGHFFAVCSRLMRQILTDYARSRLSVKRGGQAQLLPFDETLCRVRELSVDLVALDDALTLLATVDRRQSQVVELRFFAGLSVKETAEVLNISERTVKQEWMLAKLWLMRELQGPNHHGR